MALIPFTKDAYQKLQAELKKLVIEEKEILIRLQTAREMGDLSENGAYKYAKFELGSLRRQKSKVTYLITNGQIGQITSSGRIGFGSVVTISDGRVEKTYLIVSKHESNPEENKVSIESPLGQALINKQAGDEVIVTTPRGQLEYKILKIA